MDQVHVVRHKVLVEGQQIRRVGREMGIARNTVKKYLAQPAPLRVEHGPRGRPVWEKVGRRLEELLAESPRWTGGRQRLTATRLHAMLVSEGYEVGVTTVREAVVEWKRQRREVFVPLVYPAGDLAQVDFFEVLVDLAGQRIKAWMFVMRLMHFGRDFAWQYTRQDQTCFLDGHVRAFEPRTGHDKGGVESRGKAIRWQHLVPIPRDDDLDAMRATLLSRLDAAHDVGSRSSAQHPCRWRRIASTLRRMQGAWLAPPSVRSSASKALTTRCHASGLDST